MSVTEAAARARVDALIARAMLEDDHVTDPDVAFGWIVARGWVRRVGAEGPLAQFHSVRGDERLGWMLSQRGNVVAEEELTARETAA